MFEIAFQMWKTEVCNFMHVWIYQHFKGPENETDKFQFLTTVEVIKASAHLL